MLKLIITHLQFLDCSSIFIVLTSCGSHILSEVIICLVKPLVAFRETLLVLVRGAGGGANLRCSSWHQTIGQKFDRCVEREALVDVLRM